MGPLPIGRVGTHYILAVLDIFSKFIKLNALKKATTNAILIKLENYYITTIGKPESVLIDNGTQFTSGKWKKNLKELNKQHAMQRYTTHNRTQWRGITVK